MAMKKNYTLFCTVFFFLMFSVSPALKAQKGDVMVKDDVIKVNLRHPQKPSSRYLDNNEKKKKLKTSYKKVYASECPSYMQYTSRPQKERQKMMRKGKRG
jgi:hypothetical protein